MGWEWRSEDFCGDFQIGEFGRGFSALLNVLRYKSLVFLIFFAFIYLKYVVPLLFFSCFLLLSSRLQSSPSLLWTFFSCSIQEWCYLRRWSPFFSPHSCLCMLFQRLAAFRDFISSHFSMANVFESLIVLYMQRVDDILQFIADFTVHIEGVGHVCRLLCFFKIITIFTFSLHLSVSAWKSQMRFKRVQRSKAWGKFKEFPLFLNQTTKT